MKKPSILILIFITFSLLQSCGRKAATEYLPDAKRPNFKKIIDEE